MATDNKKTRRSPRLALETVIIVGLVLKVGLTGAFVASNHNIFASLIQTRPAMAQEAQPPAAAPAPSTAQPLTELSGSAQVQQMIQAIQEREKTLAAQEERLKEREKALDELEKDLYERLNEIEAQRKELAALVQKQEALLAEQKQLKNARIEHLVTAYKGMRPEKAGTLVNSLEDDVAVRILSAMPGRNAGQILAFVEPTKAARLTKAISSLRQGAAPPPETAPQN